MNDELLQLLQESQKNHLEICTSIQILLKQSTTKTDMSLKELKNFRGLTRNSSKFDLKVRALTNEKSKLTLERNKTTRKSPWKDRDSNFKRQSISF